MQGKRVVNVKNTRGGTGVRGASVKQVGMMDKSDFIAIYKKLSQQFPDAFKLRETRILKVEIHKDLRERSDLKSSQIYKFLRMYCSTKEYKMAHRAGAKRYDLDGRQVGEVTQEQIDDITKNMMKDRRKSSPRPKGGMRTGRQAMIVELDLRSPLLLRGSRGYLLQKRVLYRALLFKC